MIGILATVVGLVAYYLYNFYANIKRYPPGPPPKPFFGNMGEFTAGKLHVYLEKCQKIYGDIFTVWTPRPMVAIMNYEGMKEAFQTKGEQFIGRLGSYPDGIFQNIENGGVIFSQGQEWREQRRAAISILRDFGMGKNVMEAQVSDSIEEFLGHVESIKDKKRFDFRWPIQILVANVINNVLFGYHYKYNDAGRLVEFCDKLIVLLSDRRMNPLFYVAMKFPSVENIPIIGYYAIGQYKALARELQKHIKADIDACLKTYDENAEPQCFVHAYMQKSQKNDRLTNDQMLNVCMDFFLAGMETTSTTLRWGMLHMAKNQEVQRKMREEIHSVLGKDTLPKMSDRSRLPYTNAAVHELQRVANILPLNVIHRTIEDAEVAGYQIPADTLVMGQIFNVLSKGPLFDRPTEYRPERFLMEDMKTPNKATLEQLIPFSIGKRQCAGEGLARMELFLGLASIIQKYEVKPPLDGPIDFEPIEGGVRLPKTNLLVLNPV